MYDIVSRTRPGSIRYSPGYLNSTARSYVVIVVAIFLLGLSLTVALASNLQPAKVGAAVDIDVSGDGRAAAFDGKRSIATEGDNFCSITDDIAGGIFSSLFEGIFNCDNDNNLQITNQLSVEYSYTQNPVKLGEKTYLTLTVKDKSSGNPISDAKVRLAIGPTSPLFETDSRAMAFAAAGAAAAAATESPAQELEDRITQLMHTDKNGRATFTIQVGPESDIGTYDTEFEVTKDKYQSIFEQIDLHVI
jgi:hypothetical protein